LLKVPKPTAGCIARLRVGVDIDPTAGGVSDAVLIGSHESRRWIRDISN
jgi:hypothetical protein